MFTVFNDELARTAREIRDRHQSYARGEWTDESLAAHQLNEFRATIAYVKENSPFYARHLATTDPQAITSRTPVN